MIAAAALSRSTKVACAAPRDSASMPAAPRAREQVEHVGARQVRLEDREQGLLDPIGRAVACPDPARRDGSRARSRR